MKPLSPPNDRRANEVQAKKRKEAQKAAEAAAAGAPVTFDANSPRGRRLQHVAAKESTTRQSTADNENG